jgi:hypothetical protein
MKWFAVVGAACLFMAQYSPAFASTLTDDVSGTTSIGGGAALSGYFTYDMDTDIPLAGTIDVTGGAYAGAYSVASSPSSNDNGVAAFGNGIYELFLAFNSVLSASPDPLTSVTVFYDGAYLGAADYAPSGEAISATPLPATLPLFAGGLGFVGYLTSRRKRSGKNALSLPS